MSRRHQLAIMLTGSQLSSKFSDVLRLYILTIVGHLRLRSINCLFYHRYFIKDKALRSEVTLIGGFGKHVVVTVFD
jgi:hypothetical protein